MSKIDPRLFAAHEQALVQEYGRCPDCGAELVIRRGKHGPFLGCANYPHCEFIRPLTTHSVETEKILEGSTCPRCGHLLAIKKGRYGLFIGCTQYPACQHIESQGQEPEAERLPCPVCGQGHLSRRTSRQGKVFYACDAYPKCRYVLNDPPVAQTCPQCGWPLLVARQGRRGTYLCCPQKTCTYQSESL